MTTIRQILSITKKELSKITATPSLEAELLLTKSLNVERSFLFAHPDSNLSTEQEKVFFDLLRRRMAGEPIAYIFNKKEFWSLELKVTEDVLIPRPETELIVEKVLQKIPDDKNLFIADLGTGSGAIALAIAHERPKIFVVAVDKSLDAIRIAKFNAENLQINNINFIQSDWCEGLAANAFDIIISNPPYVRNSDPCLSKPEMQFEPRMALLGGADGLAEIKIIIEQAKDKLKDDGWLFIEHGFDQSVMIFKLLEDKGYNSIVDYLDPAGLPRVAQAKK